MIQRKLVSIAAIMLITLFTAMALPGCTSPAPTATPAPQPTASPTPAVRSDLTIYLAAAFGDTLNETKVAYQAKYPNVNVINNPGSTPALKTQIEQGAKADVFVTAGPQYMNAMVASGYMDNASVTNLSTSKVALIVPKNSTRIGNLADLAKPGTKIAIGTNTIPIYNYTVQVLGKISSNSTYGPGYKDNVMANVVTQEPTVNYIVSKVALGEVDAGFVYRSDVPLSYRDRVDVITIPDSMNVVTAFQIGMLRNSGNPSAARAYIDFLKSAEGNQLLLKYGFTPA